MAVSILVTGQGAGDNNTNPLTVVSGTDRYWLMAIQKEGVFDPAATAVHVSGDTTTNFTFITSITGGTPTMDIGLYGCKDADIGTNPSTSNGSLTYTGSSPSSSAIVVTSILLEGVDQTTPFTDTDDVGHSVDHANSTEDCPFTLDEIIDGMGIAFLSCSNTGTTWDLTDNGYAAESGGQWTNSTATAAHIATKAITSQSLGQLTTLTSGLVGSKTGTMGIMMLAPASPDVVLTPDTATMTITAFNPFILAPTLASLINTVDNYSAPGAVDNFGNGGTNTSGATFKDDTQELATIHNNARTVDLYDLGDYTSAANKIITLTLDGVDVEDIVDMGRGEFATCSEDGGRQQADIYDWPAGTTAGSKQELTLGPILDNTNSGPEGIAYNRATQTFYVCIEGAHASVNRAILQFQRPTNTTTDYSYSHIGSHSGSNNAAVLTDTTRITPWNTSQLVGMTITNVTDGSTSTITANTATTVTGVLSGGTDDDWDAGDDYLIGDGFLVVEERIDAETAFNSLGATGALWDLSGLDFDHASGNLVVCSHTGEEIAQIDAEDGTIIATKANTDLTQMEFITILPGGEYMMGGEADEFQIFESVLVITPNTASLTLTAFNATVEHDTSPPTEIAATSASMTLTAFDATVEALVNTNIAATQGSLTLTAFNPTVEVLVNNNISAAAASLTLTAFNATITAQTPVNINATTGSLTLTAFKASITSGSFVANISLTADISNQLTSNIDNIVLSTDKANNFTTNFGE